MLISARKNQLIISADCNLINLQPIKQGLLASVIVGVSMSALRV